ncbi:MAG: heme-dependent oxidative N-demethylase subunit alpha family protein, partial [Pseudomonadota bacterium]
AGLAKRVQHLFDAIAVDRPLWRANALFYNDPALHQPRSEGATPRAAGAEAAYLRSEKQVLKRLPRTGAVVFSIHTWLVARTALSAKQTEALGAAGLG